MERDTGTDATYYHILYSKLISLTQQPQSQLLCPWEKILCIKIHESSPGDDSRDHR